MKLPVEFELERDSLAQEGRDFCIELNYNQGRFNFNDVENLVSAALTLGFERGSKYAQDKALNELAEESQKLGYE